MSKSTDMRRLLSLMVTPENGSNFNKVCQFGHSLEQYSIDLSNMEKEIKDLKLQLNNLSIMSRLNPILTTILKSSTISETLKVKVSLLLDRIVTSILHSNVILEE